MLTLFTVSGLLAVRVVLIAAECVVCCPACRRHVRKQQQSLQQKQQLTEAAMTAQ
jgi:hypothetical protein